MCCRFFLYRRRAGQTRATRSRFHCHRGRTLSANVCGRTRLRPSGGLRATAVAPAADPDRPPPRRRTVSCPSSGWRRTAVALPSSTVLRETGSPPAHCRGNGDSGDRGARPPPSPPWSGAVFAQRPPPPLVGTRIRRRARARPWWPTARAATGPNT